MNSNLMIQVSLKQSDCRINDLLGERLSVRSIHLEALMRLLLSSFSSSLRLSAGWGNFRLDPFQTDEKSQLLATYRSGCQLLALPPRRPSHILPFLSRKQPPQQPENNGFQFHQYMLTAFRRRVVGLAADKDGFLVLKLGCLLDAEAFVLNRFGLMWRQCRYGAHFGCAQFSHHVQQLQRTLVACLTVSMVQIHLIERQRLVGQPYPWHILPAFDDTASTAGLCLLFYLVCGQMRFWIVEVDFPAEMRWMPNAAVFINSQVITIIIAQSLQDMNVFRHCIFGEKARCVLRTLIWKIFDGPSARDNLSFDLLRAETGRTVFWWYQGNLEWGRSRTVTDLSGQHQQANARSHHIRVMGTMDLRLFHLRVVMIGCVEYKNILSTELVSRRQGGRIQSHSVHTSCNQSLFVISSPSASAPGRDIWCRRL